ncbi:MAG: mechanosensitive ion channel family protein [Acidobacteriaceae bacterium]|nr:mechanosensitive ion channel family protein [Acidobacteriaceae bacterium]
MAFHLRARRAYPLLAVTLALLCLIPTRASSQALGGLLSGGQKTTQAVPEDPLKRTSPRSAMYAFLQAARSDNFELAAQYLDLHRIPASQRATQGPRLARELADLLNNNTQFEVLKLSNDPSGNQTDGLPPVVDKLASFDLDGNTVSLQIQRVASEGMNIWLVTAESVGLIPQLVNSPSKLPLEKKLPAPLVQFKLIGTPLYVWLALLLAALILSAVSRLLMKLVLTGLRPMVHRFSNLFHEHRLEAIAEPIRLLITILMFRACMEFVPTSALFRDLLLKLMTLLFAFAVASLLMRIADAISDRIISRLSTSERVLSSSAIPLLVRFVKICFFCFAALFVLSEWGYNTNTILAGVGVGGLAVALAAQKTIENLFGGISVISDRPVLVGDFCQFGGQVGTVEDIGLRSTRIRTLDRTLVTIPNSVFSNMTLENFSRRDRIWFHPTLSLRRDTNPDQIRALMEALKKILADHPKVSIGAVPLRFTKINNDSYSLDIFAYVETPNFDEYLVIQSELLLKILETANSIGVGFAVPFQEAFTFSKDPWLPESGPAALGQQKEPNQLSEYAGAQELRR